MASNRGVAYVGPGKVAIQAIDFPKLELKDQNESASTVSFLGSSAPTSAVQISTWFAAARQRNRG